MFVYLGPMDTDLDPIPGGTAAWTTIFADEEIAPSRLATP